MPVSSFGIKLLKFYVKNAKVYTSFVKHREKDLS